jgi:glyoxylase-like metal-dependent hydrolase (beta-lactamase superfamily II)
MGYERIEDDVYVFSSDLYAHVTAGLVFTGAGAVLIDTLPFPRETQAIVQFERRRGGTGVRYVVNTHHHADHVNGNYLFPRARVISHERSRGTLSRDGQANLEKARAETPYLAGVQLRLPDITLDNGGAIHLGGKSLEIVPLPGHAPDVLGVLLVEEKILFASDAMMPVPFIVYGDIDESRASLQAIGQMNLENLVQGHGEVLLRGEIPDALAASIAYLDAIRARVREGIEMGLSEEEIASLDIEECGLSRVPLSGLVQDLHRANLLHLFKGMLAGTISVMPPSEPPVSGDAEGVDEQPD